MSEPRQRVFIVSHTHWDREWYLPFGGFRVDLARMMGGLLDRLEADDGYDHFVLDGQTILLGDYLDLRPDDEGRIRALAEAGKLSLGPWYILPDEFLVSGEATARNLLLGRAAAAPFCPVQKVGYLPDTFGHIAQMPQILRLAGIDSFIYTRGNGAEIDQLGSEFRWRAPDGSEVLAVNQVDGYCNAGGLGHEELWHAHTPRRVHPERAVAHVRALLAKMDGRSRFRTRLLNNGCDHFPPQRDFMSILAALRKDLPECEFRHGSFADFVTALREEGQPEALFEGELRCGRLHPILTGVWSARMPLKQLNERAQTLLAGIAEPVCAATRFGAGQRYPAGEFRRAWQTLLQNHPHDSICGCSTDEVHREMIPRFETVLQTGERLARHALDGLCPSFAPEAEGDRDTALCVFNPIPAERREVVECLLVLQPFGYDMKRLGLFDDAGRPVPCEFVSTRFVERFWGIDYRGEILPGRAAAASHAYEDAFPGRFLRGPAEREASDCHITIRFLADALPALGHGRFFLRESGAPPPQPHAWVDAGDNFLENDLCRVCLHPDGSFDLHDKRSGREYPGLNRLVDGEDIGDEYDYCACRRPELVRPEAGTVRIVECGALAGTIEARFVMRLPAGIAADRSRRAGERVECPVTVRVSLSAGSPQVRISTRFENRAHDHRLRAEFATPLITDSVVSDGHFQLIRRPIERAPSGENWVQAPGDTLPQQDFSLLADAEGGLALLNRGLPEFSASREEGGAMLTLTLLRAVGWLSRDDFPSRNRLNAGPTVATPDAQCMGAHVFEYALVAFTGDALAAGVKAESDRFRIPLLTKQGVAEGSAAGGRSLVRLTGSRVCATALKRHESRDTLILRLCNLSGAEIDSASPESLRLGRAVGAAWRCDLLEDRVAPIPLSGPDRIPLTMRPCEILTIEVEFAQETEWSG